MATALCILLVEDDHEQAQLFAQLLSRNGGYTVVIASTAEKALDELASGVFALLLTDWDLPGMSGSDLIAQVKPLFPTMKAILYSNHRHVDEVCADCGADRWFRKSDDIFHLRHIVDEMLAAK